jgi:hypothetical protein
MESSRGCQGGTVDKTWRVTLIPVTHYDRFLRGSASRKCAKLKIVRYLECQIGPYEIDMKIESTNKSERYRFTGQVFDPCEDWEPQPGFIVSLFCGEIELAKTKTGKFGEFRLKHRHRGRLHVRLGYSAEIYGSIAVGEGVYAD